MTPDIQIINGKTYSSVDGGKNYKEVEEAPLRTEQYTFSAEIARLQAEKAEEIAKRDAEIAALQTKLKLTEDTLVAAGFTKEVVDVVEPVAEPIV